MTRVPFRTRILGGAVLTALLAVFLVWASVSLVLQQVGGPPHLTVSTQVRESCIADPARWREQRHGELEVLLVADDDPVVPTWLREVPIGEPVDDPGARRTFWVRDTPSGPCSVARMHFRGTGHLTDAFMIGGAAGVFLAVLAVGLASYRWTVLPLLTRIERLRVAADLIGAAGYASPSDDLNDDLAAIASRLDMSHARIVHAREELVERHHALEQHLAAIAHDLRTPIGSLMLAIEELRGDGPTAVTSRATTEVAYLSSLVDNLHQATRLRHGLDPRSGRVDLQQVVERIAVRFRALGAARGVQVEASAPEAPVWVHAEPALLERALGNVVHNATLHGRGNVAVLLDAEAGRFTVEVLDDGDGLPDERLADLAHRTFSDDPARQRHQGLGVAITNAIVDGLGWTIAYTRGDDVGTRVRIEGPLAV